MILSLIENGSENCLYCKEKTALSARRCHSDFGDLPVRLRDPYPQQDTHTEMALVALNPGSINRTPIFF